jgi:hypothetical protein
LLVRRLVPFSDAGGAEEPFPGRIRPGNGLTCVSADDFGPLKGGRRGHLLILRLIATRSVHWESARQRGLGPGLSRTGSQQAHLSIGIRVGMQAMSIVCCDMHLMSKRTKLLG